ncbi:MAG: hypothetical protein JXB38_12480 [Anaerolineales bacterium]|nr:hypothetical protein [Anaerolineales bacterium]
MPHEDKIVHFLGEICWLPPLSSQEFSPPPNYVFSVLGKITSDFDLNFTILVNYSTESLSDECGCYKAKFCIPFLDNFEINTFLEKYAQLIAWDGFHILAVCRNLQYVAEHGLTMGSDFFEVEAGE